MSGVWPHELKRSGDRGARLRPLQDGLESKIVQRRTMADEDGHYCFAAAL